MLNVLADAASDAACLKIVLVLSMQPLLNPERPRVPWLFDSDTHLSTYTRARNEEIDPKGFGTRARFACVPAPPLGQAPASKKVLVL